MKAMIVYAILGMLIIGCTANALDVERTPPTPDNKRGLPVLSLSQNGFSLKTFPDSNWEVRLRGTQKTEEGVILPYLIFVSRENIKVGDCSEEKHAISEITVPKEGWQDFRLNPGCTLVHLQKVKGKPDARKSSV